MKLNSINLYCAVKLKFYMVKVSRILPLLIIFFAQNSLFAQIENASVPLDWFLRDPLQDSVQGLSVEKRRGPRETRRGSPGRPEPNE